MRSSEHPLFQAPRRRIRRLWRLFQGRITISPYLTFSVKVARRFGIRYVWRAKAGTKAVSARLTTGRNCNKTGSRKRGFALTAVGARSGRGGKHAVLVALASIFLASCTTADNNVPMGFASIAASVDMDEANDFAGVAAEPAISAAGEVMPAETAMSAGAPLPEGQVAQEEMTDGAAPNASDAQEILTALQQSPDPQNPPADSDIAQAGETEAAPQQAAALAEPDGDEAGMEGLGTETVGQQARQATQFLENIAPTQAAALAPEPRKRGLFAFFSSGNNARQAPQQTARNNRQAPTISPSNPAPVVASAAATPIIQLASTGEAARPLIDRSADALPGVRQDALFEIKRRSGLDDDGDIDLHEDGLYQVASIAPGMARLAPNGLLKQRDDVDVSCLKPSLVRVLKAVERHFGRKMVVTSGYRSPDHNRRVRGARNSLHMYCAAADVQVEGVSKWDLAQYVRSMPGRGGVGTYCHTESVHIDIGPERDWNWRCRRRK